VDRFGFAEPDAAGLVISVLGLTTDIALPGLGRVLTAMARPASRLLAASRLRVLETAASRAVDVATLAAEANAAHLEVVAQRTGLDRIERQAR
jgi:hypothetical protein